MAPDLNSLPPSRSPSNSTSPIQSRPAMNVPTEPTNINTPPSPHSPSLSSLQAAASINAGIRNSPDRNSPRFERRRSSLMMNIHLNDPTIPGPGELQTSHGAGGGMRSPSIPENPQHHRAPSLGEIHQQLENEQEAQVNRLLHMIRTQQDQITALEGSNAPGQADSTGHSIPAMASPVIDVGTRSRTSSLGQPSNILQQQHQSIPRSPRQRPISLSRQSSRMSGTGLRSGSQSPMLQPLSSAYDPQREDWLLGGARDESTFYQAETQMLTRENQMLKQRIRELERQLGDINPLQSTHGGLGPHVSHNPAAVSPLASPPVVPEQSQSSL